MPRKKNDVATDTMTTDLVENENNYREAAPYQARWITVKQAASELGLTGQTVRNALETHAVFNPEQGDKPWYVTRLKDEFGNITEYRIIYIDQAAAARWAEQRDERGHGAWAGGARRYIVRLTDEQAARLNAMITGASEFAGVVLERPKQYARRKENGIEAETENEQTDLFDVLDTEVELVS